MSEMASNMAEDVKNRLLTLPTPGPDPAIEEIARKRAIEAAQAEMGQYFSPHVREGINIAIGTFITELIRLEERGEE